MGFTFIGQSPLDREKGAMIVDKQCRRILCNSLRLDPWLRRRHSRHLRLTLIICLLT